MLAIGGQTNIRQEQGAMTLLPRLRPSRARAMTLIWRRDRLMHLVLGLSGAISFPFMVAAAIGTGLPFGIASSLSVAHLAAAVPGIALAERMRLSRIVSGFALLWSGLCVAIIAVGTNPAFGWEAALSLTIAACPAIANFCVMRRQGLSKVTSRDIDCLQTYAADEAVIITDRQGRILGSTWAARRLVDGLANLCSSNIAQIADIADRPALSAALLRSAQNASVEECDVLLANTGLSDNVKMTIKPVASDRLAVVLGKDQNGRDERPLVDDPVLRARNCGFGQNHRSQLADGARANAGKTGTNVREIVEFAIRLARADAERSGISIDFSCSDHSVETACDRRALTQIVINLLNNAIKFSNHGGHVSVDVCGRPGTAFIRISDRGIGIAEADQKQIFAFRGRSGDEDRNGHGIGLSIVSDLIDSAGGTIQLSSRLGFGTSVDVRLPIAGAEDRHSDNPAIQFWQLAAE